MFVHMGNFSLVDRDAIKEVDHKLVSFAAVVALPEDSWNFTSKANSHIPQVKIHADKNYAIFAAMLRKRSYFVWEIFVPVNRAGVFIRENFHHGFREISVPASDMNTSRFLRIEEWRGEISDTEPARSTGFYEETLKSVFHLSSQICGSVIEALSKTGPAKKSKQYQLLRFCQNKNLGFHKYVCIDTQR